MNSKVSVQKINIARGFFATLAALLALATIVTLGVNMDYANFPGSNIVLDSYPEDDPNGRSGLIQKIGGFQIKNSNTCSNFEMVVTGKTCGSVAEGASVALTILDTEGNEAAAGTQADGWLIAPPCAKTGDLNTCSPFGADSALAVLGQATFGVLAINVVLFGVHTGLEMNMESITALVSMEKKSVIFGLNIVWTIVAFSLYVWAAVAWRGMCDKIDTGLGRHVVTDAGVRNGVCATSYCTISFGGFMASFVVALLVARVPDILIFFAVLGLKKADNLYSPVGV